MLNRPPFARFLIIFTLVVSGEIIFLLPFVLPRIFKPTMLEIFDITNLELGIAFSIYGTIAAVAYFFGGPLADRFSARRLMAIALAVTAVGGVVFALFPGLHSLYILYGFWGLTTILIFWAALIRATREWGGKLSQGKAFGLLDGGRGLVAAVIASASVAILAAILPADVGTASLAQRAQAFNYIVWIYAAMVFATALLVWASIPDSSRQQPSSKSPAQHLVHLKSMMGKPYIWLQTVVVLCAYVAYKGTDNFSLYAYDAFGYDHVAAARIAAISFWIRPIAAIGAGLLADVTRASNIIMISFAILMMGMAVMAFGLIPVNSYWLLLGTIAGASCGIYALRGVYFALLGEGRIPLAITGSAVGLVSVVGYTPDIFMGPVTGYLIDSYPGAQGHQYVFGMIGLFALVGLAAAWWFRKATRLT